MDGSVIFARWRQCASPLIVVPWTHATECLKQHLEWYIRNSLWQRALYFTMGHHYTLFLSKFPLHVGDVNPHVQYCLGYTRVRPPQGISVGSAICAGLTVATDRWTLLRL